MLETSERVCDDCGEPITDDSEFCRWCGSYSPSPLGSTISAGIGALPLERGHRLGGYVIEGLIARGAMGIVYRARDESLDRSVAIKVVAPEFAGDEDLRRRFEQEAVAAARIEHPGILPVYAVGEEQGVVFIVSRLVEGPNLKLLVGEKGPLDPVQVADLVAQLGLAIDAAHAGGVLHRDIKPANVLLASSRNGTYHAYLADFGLSKLVAQEAGLTRAGEVVGTADYLAPEQINRGRLDERTDLYALGCLGYYCLNGRPPFRRGTVPATMWAHLHEDPPELASVEGELRERLAKVLEKAVAKDPRARFENGAALGKAISDAAAPASAKRAVARKPSTPRAESVPLKPKPKPSEKPKPAEKPERQVSSPPPRPAAKPDPAPKKARRPAPAAPDRRSSARSRVPLLAFGGGVLAIAALLFSVGPLDSVFESGTASVVTPVPPFSQTWEKRERDARDAELRKRAERKAELLKESRELVSEGKGLRGSTLEGKALERGIRAAERAEAQAKAGNFSAASSSLEKAKGLIAKAERSPIPVVPVEPEQTYPGDFAPAPAPEPDPSPACGGPLAPDLPC